MTPKSLADSSQTLSMGGTGLSLFGDAFKGIASSNMYKYQGGIARMKENIANQNADYAIYAGDREAQRYGMKAAHQFGKIVTAQAASNIDVNRGSNVRVQEGQRAITRMDIDQIGQNAARKAYGHKIEAASESAKAKAYDMAADNALMAGGINMGSTLLTGATSVHSRWLQARQLGIYGEGGSFFAPDDL